MDGFDSYEDTLKREIEEELNLTDNDILKVTPLSKILYKD